MDKCIAEQAILWRHSDGVARNIAAKFGAATSGPDGRWSCNVIIEGIDKREEEVAGGTSMQAVKLALNHLSSRMRYLVKSGEIFSFVDDPQDVWDEEAIGLVFGGAPGSNFSSKPTP